MKSTIKVMFLVCVLGVSQACNDLLDNPNPSTAVSQEVALSNADAINGIRARMYDRLHDAPELNTLWMLGPSALADNTDIRPGRTRFIDLNENEFREGIGSEDAYEDLYDLINDANILINGVRDGVLTQANRTKLRGEGYFMRALALHHLVRIFGYEPGMAPSSGAGADFNLGVIMRTEPTLDVASADLRERSTVEQVYTQILSDINNAITDLDSSSDDGPFFVTSAAAQALLARVQLYQRNYSEADAAAMSAITSSGARLATPSEVATMFDENSSNPEAIFTVDVNPTTESGGVNNGLAAYTSTQWMAQIPTQDLIDLYEAGDPRLDAWYTPCINDVTGSDPGGCQAVNTNALELHKYAAEQGQFADDYVHFRVSEMILIQAEARLNTEATTAGAISKLNELRAERGLGPYSGGITFDEVLDEILNERRRELVAEGHRFFDLKRLGRDLRKVSFDSGTGTTTVRFLPYESSVMLDDIPEPELEVNPMLVQNPFFE